MELLKAILALITSFFQNSTAKKVEEVNLADKTEEATVEKIRATENAKAVEQQKKLQEELSGLRTKQKEEHKEQSKKSLDEQLNDQFGEDE